MDKSKMQSLIAPMTLIAAMEAAIEEGPYNMGAYIGRPERAYSPTQKKGASPYKKARRKMVQASRKRNR